VRSGLGWRPQFINCRACASVTAKVTEAGTRTPVANAHVTALVFNHPYVGTTGGNGLASLVDAQNRSCVPAGNVPVVASADRHETSTVVAIVPDNGSLEVDIELECTQVSGKVVDQNGTGVSGVIVFLRDPSVNPPVIINDAQGLPYQVTTGQDGTFAFFCVPHRLVQVWTPDAPTDMQHVFTVPPQGVANVTIMAQVTCGNLIGTVKDDSTVLPIAGARVTLSNGFQTTTDANGAFAFACVRPAGQYQVIGSAAGYLGGFTFGIVPTTGSSLPVDLRLFPLVAVQIRIKLEWSVPTLDLDSHLSGPDLATGSRFHVFWGTIGNPPVSYASLDTDTGWIGSTQFGPETVTITPIMLIGFAPGNYRYWVHKMPREDQPPPMFAGSNAIVTVSSVDHQANVSQLGQFAVQNATGPEDNLWHVVDLTIDSHGNVTLAPVQNFHAGDTSTVL
jgi:hypothetical protein